MRNKQHLHDSVASARNDALRAQMKQQSYYYNHKVGGLATQPNISDSPLSLAVCSEWTGSLWHPVHARWLRTCTCM